MPKTDDEKLRDKAAALVRRRAHRDRYKALHDAEVAAQNAPAVLEAHRVAEQADELWRAAQEAVAVRERALLQQIEALQAEIQTLRADPSLIDLAEKRRQAYSRAHDIERKHVAAAAEGFPDLKGGARWSIALWTPPAEVVAAMDAARKNPAGVLAKPRQQKVSPRKNLADGHRRS